MIKLTRVYFEEGTSNHIWINPSQITYLLEAYKIINDRISDKKCTHVCFPSTDDYIAVEESMVDIIFLCNAVRKFK
jgi:hypothetical protein